MDVAKMTILYQILKNSNLVTERVIRELLFINRKAGRSGRVYAVMMMSTGRGLA